MWFLIAKSQFLNTKQHYLNSNRKRTRNIFQNVKTQQTLTTYLTKIHGHKAHWKEQINKF